jgi:hypothetical protein
MGEVRGAQRQRSAVGTGGGNECISAVEGNIEPLVAIRDPGVRAIGAVHQMPKTGGGSSPQAKRTINVHPGVKPPGNRDNIREPVKRSGINVARLQDDQSRS